MARNRYPGTCYCCGAHVPVGFGHFERHNSGWRIKCVKCASGRIVKETDKEVQRVVKMNKQSQGMVFTGSIKQVNTIVSENAIDEVWVIVRSYRQKLKEIPGVPIIHVPELSPSLELFQLYLGLKRANKWGVDDFKNGYVPRFLCEMLNDAARHRLTQLVNDTQHGKRILLLCYCEEEALCHRSIIRGLLQGRGVACGAVSKEQIEYDYSFYYDTYLDLWRKQPRLVSRS